MKKIHLLALLLVINHFVISQVVQEQRMPANSKVIPKIVLSTFNEQYPQVLVRGWYVTQISYWYNDISSGWYSDWYGQRTIVVYPVQQPNYFEVEFIGQPGELSRAIYNKFGHWYETRTQLKGLPIKVHESLKTSPYADWKRSSFVEKIELAEWPETIYRFQVRKGAKSRIIRMNPDGVIIQEKYIN